MNNNPFEAPRSSTSSSEVDPDRLYVRDGVVFAPIHAALPNRCASCGRADVALTESKSFTWSPLWARLTVLLSPLIAIIAIVITRKSATLMVSLCDVDQRRIARNSKIGWVVLLGGTATIVASVFSISAIGDGFFAVMAVGIALVLAAIVAFTKTMVVRPTYIDKMEARYSGVHADVLAAIERGET